MRVFPKVYNLSVKKNTLLRMLYWEEQTIVSVAAKRGNRYILLQSRVVFSNSFSKSMFKVSLLNKFDIRIKYISLEDDLSVDKILASLIM